MPINPEDVQYLASHFSSLELAEMLHKADVERGVAMQFDDDFSITFWEYYGDSCQLAIDRLRVNRPKVELKEGQVSVAITKEANDIVSVISQYTTLTKTGKEYVGNCPFHEEKHPSLHVSQEKQLFYCFSCQRKGDVVNFIMQVENVDTKQACLLLDSKVTSLEMV